MVSSVTDSKLIVAIDKYFKKTLFTEVFLKEKNFKSKLNLYHDFSATLKMAFMGTAFVS